MNIKEKAQAYHNTGYNCAQSVLAVCGDYTGVDEKTLLAVSGGFGSGLRSGETCGAICGAVMAIGLANPYNDCTDAEAKDKIAVLTKNCVATAREKFGAVSCRELAGDKSRCPFYIGEMAAMAEDIIKNN